MPGMRKFHHGRAQPLTIFGGSAGTLRPLCSFEARSGMATGCLRDFGRSKFDAEVGFVAFSGGSGFAVRRPVEDLASVYLHNDGMANLRLG